MQGFFVELQMAGITARAAQVVDQFVARDRMRPGGDGTARVIGMPGQMEGQQNLLQNILGLAGIIAPGSRQHAAEIASEALADGV